MKRLSVFLALGLAACTPQPASEPTEVSLLRNPTAPIGSQADVTAADLAGEWTVRQRAQGGWPQGRLVQFQTDGDDLVLLADAVTCGPNDLCESLTVAVPYPAGVAGRFGDGQRRLAPGLDVPADIWVYWMDFDRRTVALGDPNGQFVAILDRSVNGGGDRITAAREILDWYGYDLTRVVSR